MAKEMDREPETKGEKKVQRLIEFVAIVATGGELDSEEAQEFAALCDVMAMRYDDGEPK